MNAPYRFHPMKTYTTERDSVIRLNGLPAVLPQGSAIRMNPDNHRLFRSSSETSEASPAHQPSAGEARRSTTSPSLASM